MNNLTPIYFNTNVNIDHSKGFEPNHVIYELSFCICDIFVTYSTIPSRFNYCANQSFVSFKTEEEILRAFIKYIDTRQAILNTDDIFVTYTSWDIQNLKNRFKFYGLKSINLPELNLFNVVQKLIKYKTYQFFAVLDDIFKTNFYYEYNSSDNEMPTLTYVLYLELLHKHLSSFNIKINNGYHRIKIPKGVLGEFSKIEEEFTELKDAVEQNNPILISCELSDLIGAIEEYAKKYNLSLNDIINFSNLTKNAFQSGKRK